MKKMITMFMMLLTIPSVLADYGDMMGYGMMGSWGMGFFWIIWFPLAAFIFSVILWATYNWMVKGNRINKGGK